MKWINGFNLTMVLVTGAKTIEASSVSTTLKVAANTICLISLQGMDKRE